MDSHASLMESSATPRMDSFGKTIFRFLLTILRVPLVILYFAFNILVHTLSVVKNLQFMGQFYQKRHKKIPEYSTRLNYLIEKLSDESDRSRQFDRRAVESAQSFRSLYNTEDGKLNQDIVKNTYSEVVDICSDQCKYIFLYIHDSLLDDSMSYVNNILCADTFVKAMAKYQALIWFTDITFSEGLNVAQSFKVTKFPFLGLLSVNKSSKVELIYKFEGSLESFNLSSLLLVMAKEHSNLIAQRQKQQDLAIQRLIREQQDSRFNEALRRDQLADIQRQEESARAISEQQKHELEQQWIKWRAGQLKSEPSSSQDACRVAIRLNDGRRITRKFDSSLPIEEIYAFVELYRRDSLEVSESSTYPEGYEHTYDFKLMNLVPKRELQLDSIMKDDSNIYPSGNIVMEDL